MQQNHSLFHSKNQQKHRDPNWKQNNTPNIYYKFMFLDLEQNIYSVTLKYYFQYDNSKHQRNNIQEPSDDFTL